MEPLIKHQTESVEDGYLHQSVNVLKTVETLIKAGADVNTADDLGWTPLFRAIHYDHSECVPLLLAAGADVNMVDLGTERGWSPLMVAVSKDEKETVDRLITAGADVNIQDRDGKTPLLLTSKKGNTDIARKLISANSRVNQTDSFSAKMHCNLT